MAIFAWSITYIDGRNFAHIGTDGGFPNLSSSEMTKKKGGKRESNLFPKWFCPNCQLVSKQENTKSNLRLVPPPGLCNVCRISWVVLPISWVHNFITTLLSMDVDLSVYNPIQKRARCIKWVFLLFFLFQKLYTHTRKRIGRHAEIVSEMPFASLRLVNFVLSFFGAMTGRLFEINWAKRRRRRTRKKEKDKLTLKRKKI